MSAFRRVRPTGCRSTHRGGPDRIAASGTATLGGGTVDVQAGRRYYGLSTRYTILTAAGGVTGQFSGLTTTSNLAFLDPALSYDADDVVLGFTRKADFGAAAGRPRTTGRRRRGCRAWGRGCCSMRFCRNRRRGRGRAFDAVSGEVQASAVTAGIEDTRLVRDAVLGRLDAAPAGPATGSPAVGPGAGRAGAEVLWSAPGRGGHALYGLGHGVR